MKEDIKIKISVHVFAPNLDRAEIGRCIEHRVRVTQLMMIEATTGAVGLVQRYEHDTAPTRVGVLR